METATTVALALSLLANIYVLGRVYFNYRKKVKNDKKKESFNEWPSTDEKRLKEIKEAVHRACVEDGEYNQPNLAIMYFQDLNDIEDLSPEAIRRDFKAAIESEDYEEAGNIKSIADERGIELKS